MELMHVLLMLVHLIHVVLYMVYLIHLLVQVVYLIHVVVRLISVPLLHPSERKHPLPWHLSP